MTGRIEPANLAQVLVRIPSRIMEARGVNPSLRQHLQGARTAAIDPYATPGDRECPGRAG